LSVSEGTLLVVDDFELNRDMLTRRLTSRGFRVYGAESGRTALTMIEGMELDLVLLDIMMPDLDGFEVLAQLREKFSSTELAVIMVTAKDQSDDIVRALELGADDYVTKPIDFPVALARIRTQLNRRRTEIALRESEERYALAAKGANDGLWDWDLRTNEVYYSERWKVLAGYEPSDEKNNIEDWFVRVHPDDLIRVKQEIDKHLEGSSPTFLCEYRIKSKDGSWRWLVSRGKAVIKQRQAPTRMVGWQSDSNERVAHDSLTALPNRALFLDRLSWALTSRDRTSAGKFLVFYMGIDRFKIINESVGYEQGNKVLVQLAQRIEALLGPKDTLARLGGDEFAMLVDDIEGVGSGTQIAERVKSVVATPFLAGGQDIHITVSMGILIGDGSEQDPDNIMLMSQNALSLAKAKGKDRYEFYREGMAASVVSTLQKENQLRKALEKNELFLAYQPQIDTKTGRIVGVEALIRWQNPTLGFVSPAQFIPLAEETGLIVSIGAWVLAAACKQNKAWQDAGLPAIRVAVNISSRQFRQGNLLALIDQNLKETGLEAHWLDVELTESMLLESVTQTVNDLKCLHDLGVHISLDDFGTGYSSLSYLKQLPIDTLKIDQSFVRDITTDPDDAAICSAIISMAHSMRMGVIAEGVETQEDLNYLKQLSCDEMQGYFFSRPTDPETIAKLLAENRTYI